MRNIRTLTSILLVAVSGSIGVFCQAPNSAPSQTPEKIVGYFDRREPGFLDILPPYPQFNSTQDEADVTTLWKWQHPEDSRWELANMDEAMSYKRFSQAFGREINNATTPLLLHLLNRTVQDVQSVAFDAKSFYNRPRPFQRFQLAHVCGTDKPPSPEIPLKGGSSYPSGHTSFGWATALVLAEVAPEHAQELLARAQEYGESRVVCAMHYPSDVVGGQLVATAVVARLHADSEFNQDLACAREEHTAGLKPGEQLSAVCESRKVQLSPERKR